MLEIIITSSTLILCVLAIRKLFMGRIKPVMQYGLWLVVLLRLMLPFSFPSPVSVMNTVPENYLSESVSPAAQVRLRTGAVGGPVPAMAFPLEPSYVHTENMEAPAISISPRMILLFAWLTGFLLIISATVYSNLKFSRRIRRCAFPADMPGYPPVKIMEGLSSPCLFGLIRPVILIPPEAASHASLKYILRHERCHYRCLDNWIALLRSLCCAVYWFNPLVWIAARVSRLDGELACDERVTRRLDTDERIAYGETLLSLVRRKASNHLILSTTMANGNIKRRIQMIAMKRKPAMLAAVLCVALLLVTGAATFTGAAEKTGGETALEHYQRISDEFVEEHGGVGDMTMTLEPEILDEYPTEEEFRVYLDEVYLPIIKDYQEANQHGNEPGHDPSNVTFENGADIAVFIDSEQADLNGRAAYGVRIGGHDEVMIPLEPVFAKAGIAYEWDEAVKQLRFTNMPGGEDYVFTADMPGYMSGGEDYVFTADMPGYMSGGTPWEEGYDGDSLPVYLTQKSDGLYILSSAIEYLITLDLTKPYTPLIYHDLNKIVLVSEEEMQYQNYVEKLFQTRQYFDRADYPLIDGQLSVLLNGQVYTYTAGWPYVIRTDSEDYVMLPLTETCEALGIKAVWDELSQQVSVSADGGEVYVIEDGVPISGEAVPEIVDGILYISHIDLQAALSGQSISDYLVYPQAELYVDHFTEESSSASMAAVSYEYDVFNKMLNSVDYFNTLNITFRAPLDYGNDTLINCQTDINKSLAYQSMRVGGELTAESVSDGEIIYHADHQQKTITTLNGELRTRADDPPISLMWGDERMTIIDTSDGQISYVYRANVTNCDAASYTMFPQEIAFSYLADFNTWEVARQEKYLNRSCYVITGKADEYIGEKHGLDSFEMLVDEKTGVLLKLTGISNGTETDLIAVEELSYSPFEVKREFSEENDVSVYDVTAEGSDATGKYDATSGERID